MKARYMSPTIILLFLAPAFAAAPARAQVGRSVPTEEVPLARSVGIASSPYDRMTDYVLLDGFLVGDPQESAEIRIMNRIITAALSAVEAPGLPEGLSDEEKAAVFGSTGYTVQEMDRTAVTGISVPSSSVRYYGIGGSRAVAGFYMNGYGYLFTVRWSLQPRSSIGFLGDSGDLVMSLQAQNRQIEELLAQRQEARSGEAARRATEPERETAQRVQDTLEQRRQRAGELAVMLETWRTEYENRIVEALKTTLATYGHTLVRAAENEAVTLLFEQGDDEAHNITLTVPRGRLGGPDQLERSKQAIRVSRGTNEMSDALRTQVSIMNEIIAESFRDFGVRREGEAIEMLNQVYALAGTWTSGSSRARYLPGYGVIFNRSARMSSVLTEADVLITTDEPARAGTGRNSFRTILDDPEQFQARLEEHFEALMLKTAEILATYGSTLTELAATDWIGFNYDVGSGAALLQSGVSTFLVQARMSDVRQAASQTAPAQWLYGRLVTNKKPE